MAEFLKEALTSGPFLPHGHCYLWIPELVWLHVVSDTLIALAYYVMPIALVYVVRKRRDLPFDWMFLMFGAFIVACGTTHLMGVWNLWYPTYWASGAVKAMTASISLTTAALLLPLVPRALAIPSPAQLEAINRDLEEQILEREQAEAALLEARDALELRVQARTAELAAANQALQAEIAERRRVEAYFRLLVEDVQDYAIIGLDADGKVVSWNAGAERIKGYRSEDIIGQHVSRFYVEEEVRRGRPERNLQVAAAVGRCEDEGWHVRKDGSRFWANVVLTGLRDETGRLLGFAKVMRDLTEQRRAQEMLQQSQQMLRLVLENIPQHVFWKDRASVYLGCNKIFAHALGLQAEDIIGKTDDDLPGVTPAEVERFRLSDRCVIEQDRPAYHIIEQIHRPDGRVAWLEKNKVPLHDTEGRVIGVLGTYEDITERKQAEEALRDREALLRAIVNTAVDGIITIDEQGIVQSYNPAAERLFGYTAQEVIGHNVAMLMPSPYREEHDTYLANYLRTGQAKIIGIGREVLGQRKDGSVFPIELAVSEVHLGNQRMFAGIVHDVTERKAAEEALHKAVVDTMQHAAQLRGLSEAALAINSALSLAEVLQVTTERARAIIGAHQAVTRLAVEQNWAQAINAVSLSDKYAAWRTYDEQLDGSGIYALVCHGNHPIRLTQEELEAHPAWRGFGKAKDRHPPMRGWLAAPLIGRDGRNMGLIQLSDKYEGEFTENDESIIVQLAQMASVGIENMRLFREAQAAEERLRRQLQYTKSITDSLGEGVYAVDREGRLTFVNPAAQTMLGWTEAELLGRSSHEVIGLRPGNGTTLSRHECDLLAVVMRDVRLQRGEVAFTRKDGTILPIDYASSPIEIDGEVVGAVVAFNDITERKQAEEALRDAHALLEKIFSSLDEALFLVEASTRTIITCNPAVARVFGYSPHEVLGRNTAFLYPSDERYAAFGDELKDALDAHGVHHAELQMRRKDGSLFIAEATVSAIVNEAGQRDRVVSVWRDITERKQAEEAIKNLNAELEQRVIERTAQLEATNHELETFSYSVSHDLRAPLRSLDGFSQALLEDYAERLDAEGQDYLQRIRGATKRMAELIDALLALSRVTRAELQRDAVNLSSMARAIAAELQRQEPGRPVEWIIADGLVAKGDARLLRVVLENLLGNAWKFTAKTSVPRIEFGRLSQDDGTEAFFVSDNGAGFDMAYADKLFGAFQRLHRAGEFQGTGIGLATVQRIILRHGGRVWARGSVDEGATFYFAL
jgi:PAS domain S-box-containing protein